MHICFNALDYPSSVSGGGVGNQVRLLAQALVRQGHRVSVIDLAGPGLPDVAWDEGITIHRIRCSSWHWYLCKLPFLVHLLPLSVLEIELSFAAYRRIQAIHASDPIDLVEGTETGMLFLPLCMPHLPSIIRLHGEPYSFVKHTPDLQLNFELRLSRLLQRLALRRVRLLLSPSRRHAAEIQEELGAATPPLEVVPNTIADNLFTLSNVSENTAEPSSENSEEKIDGPIVLFVGRLERRKGVPLLLQAASRVLADVPNAHFVLAGARYANLSEKDLDELLQQLPDRKRVHLLGHVRWERLLEWYRRAALCVLPSYYETFGLAALEPMAFRLPVVALSAGALPEVVEDQVTGLLVAPTGPAPLAEAITRLLKDGELRHRLGENGRRAAQRFHVTQHLRDNLELFRWAARRNPLGPAGEMEHVFFSPHLDDAVLSCGGLIHAAIGRGEKVRAVTVFAGVVNRPLPSAFARHLHANWGLRESSANRLEEDHRAFHRLGVAAIEHWGFLEAPYRHDEAGQSLYCTYDELKGRPAAADASLVEEVIQCIRRGMPSSPVACRLYFPLALGGHVDHRLLFQVGLRLRADGCDVRFYEDWPYADAYERSGMALGWLSETVGVCLAAKHAATLEYRSQLPGMGNSSSALRARLAKYALQVGNGHPRERYWFVTPTRAARMVQGEEESGQGPFLPKSKPAAPSAVRRILSLLRGIELTHLLPCGEGDCLVLGGTETDRMVIEGSGYRCRHTARTEACGSSSPSSLAAIVVWEPMGLSVAEQLLRDAFVLLEPGGVIVGRLRVESAAGAGGVMSSLDELLRRQDFRDVRMRPGCWDATRGLAGWFAHHFGGAGKQLAVAFSAAGLLAKAGIRIVGRCWRRPCEPGGSVSLQLADHVVFMARKGASRARCLRDC